MASFCLTSRRWHVGSRSHGRKAHLRASLSFVITSATHQPCRHPAEPFWIQSLLDGSHRYEDSLFLRARIRGYYRVKQASADCCVDMQQLGPCLLTTDDLRHHAVGVVGAVYSIIGRIRFSRDSTTRGVRVVFQSSSTHLSSPSKASRVVRTMAMPSWDL